MYTKLDGRCAGDFAADVELKLVDLLFQWVVKANSEVGQKERIGGVTVQCQDRVGKVSQIIAGQIRDRAGGAKSSKTGKLIRYGQILHKLGINKAIGRFNIEAFDREVYSHRRDVGGILVNTVFQCA